jgi:hypothetical protein
VLGECQHRVEVIGEVRPEDEGAGRVGGENAVGVRGVPSGDQSTQPLAGVALVGTGPLGDLRRRAGSDHQGVQKPDPVPEGQQSQAVPAEQIPNQSRRLVRILGHANIVPEIPAHSLRNADGGSGSHESPGQARPESAGYTSGPCRAHIGGSGRSPA